MKLSVGHKRNPRFTPLIKLLLHYSANLINLSDWY
jgi:hypothetical protein